MMGLDKWLPSEVPASALALGAIGSAALALWALDNKQRRRCPLPPGPKPLPLLGNMLDIPLENETQKYEEWYRKYGDIVHISALGQHIIYLNTAEAVTELLERRSATSSSRPTSVMLSELMEFGSWNLVVQEYGDEWRKNRKLFHAATHSGVVPKYQQLQIRRARDYLKWLKGDAADNLHASVRKHVGYTIVDVVYGVENDRRNYLVNLAEELMLQFGAASKPGAFMVDIFPALKHLPRWFPGTSFHKFADRTRSLSDELRQAPMKDIKKAIAEGTANPCMVTQLLEIADEHVAGAAGSIAYAAGSDTTVSTLLTFILAMCNYPEVQAKAQEEIDAVVGADRLPDFNDRPKLPYVNAILNEVLRWQPVTPIGAAHTTIVDEEYNGYFIPKGSILLGNVWSIMHNPEEFPEPEQFRPERFLKTLPDWTLALDASVRDPRTMVFGFGRRVCPGRFLAEQSLFANMVSILAAYAIAPPRDGSDAPVWPAVEMSSGIAAHPLPFKCVIRPRSARAAELVDLPLPERGL